MGLNISRKLCHVHGGEVGVSSKTGCGSTFGFFFRVKRTEEPQDYESRAEEQEVDNAPLRCQIKELGNVALQETDGGIFPESLKNPPVEITGDMVAPSNEQQDDRYKRTAQIASNVQEEGIHLETNDCLASHDGWRGSQNLRAGLKSPAPAGKHESQLNMATPSGTPAPERRGRAHILLVEDNVINQKIVVRKLENKGYSVTAANNGKEAVETVKSTPKPSTGDRRAFDICLMDMEMPVMDGNTATKAIRELERQGTIEHIPILGVTANVRDEQQAEM